MGNRNIFKSRNLKQICFSLELYDKVLAGGGGFAFKLFRVLGKKLFYLYAFSRYLVTNKASMPFLDFIVTTRCTLKCKECNNLTPLYSGEAHYTYDFSRFKEDLDKLLEAVDLIYEIKLIGGEPLLAGELDKMLEYACSKKRIQSVIVVTNGTLLPGAKLVQALKKNAKAAVYVSNYEAAQNAGVKYDETVSFLKENSIRVKTHAGEVFKWNRVGGIYKGNRAKEHVKLEFQVCWMKDNPAVSGGFLSICSRAHAVKNIFKDEGAPGDFLDIRNGGSLKEKIKKFYRKDFFGVCDFCHMTNFEYVAPAVQTDVSEAHKQPALL
jgi:organic radical activating enzyme